MKNIRFFPTLYQYKEYVHTEIITTRTFEHVPFYRGLIDFVIDHRAPLFFEASEPSEYSHFTQYFNFVLLRTDYRDMFIRDMFFTHDFVHMVFDNPMNVRDLSFELFCEIVNNNEYVASNETETLTYYRVPAFRQKALTYTIMYDLLRHHGVDAAPSHEELLKLRKAIVFDELDGGLGSHPDSARVFSYLRKFKENNALWCRLWYDNLPKVSSPYFKKRICLPLESYDKILTHYHHQESEAQYQNNMLLNISNALEMIGEKDLPQSFSDCAEAVKLLEDKIIMPDVAREFHALYMKNKFK